MRRAPTGKPPRKPYTKVVHTPPSAPLDPQRRYCVKDAAAYLSTSTPSVYKLIHAGLLETVKEGRRTYITGRSIAARSRPAGSPPTSGGGTDRIRDLEADLAAQIEDCALNYNQRVALTKRCDALEAALARRSSTDGAQIEPLAVPVARDHPLVKCSDSVLVVLPGIGTLSLTREAYDAALVKPGFAPKLKAPDARQESGLETIVQFAAENAQSNLYPSTVWALRGLHRNRSMHGLSEAFVTVGRRVLINRVKFYELLEGARKHTPAAFVPTRRRRP